MEGCQGAGNPFVVHGMHKRVPRMQVVVVLCGHTKEALCVLCRLYDLGRECRFQVCGLVYFGSVVSRLVGGVEKIFSIEGSSGCK